MPAKPRGGRGCAPARAAIPAAAARALERVGYRVTSALGAGGYGEVLAAVSPAGDDVAIKVARRDRPFAEARLLREAAAIRAIGPPHVPAFGGVHRLGDGTLALVMERLAPPTLAARLAAAAGPLSPEEVGSLAAAILRALEAVHARGIVHGDLKPANVFVAERSACLVDFGLARYVDGEEVDITSDEAAGTPAYMAPEQHDPVLGEIDARTDVYAMGVLLFEMLTGQLPFRGSAAEVRDKHRSHRPPRPSELAALPPALDEVVLCCLAKVPADRFPGALALASALDAAVRAVVTTRPPPPPLDEAVADAGHAPGPPASPRERRTVALLFFTSDAELSLARAAVAPFGGQVAFVLGPRFVAAFDHDAGDNPARRAVAAARALLAEGVSAGARVDLLPVSVQRRPAGARRYQSRAFTEDARFPRPSDPPGVLASPAVAELVPGPRWIGVADRPELMLLEGPSGEASPAPVEVRVGPPVGRDDVLAQLVAAARRAACGVPTTARVLGDPGQGKSHLARALAARLRHALPEAAIVSLVAHDPVDGSPERLRGELLHAALALPAAASADAGRALLSARLGDALARRLSAGIALALGWAGPDDAALSALRAAPGALRVEAAHAVGEALRCAARERPLLVLLDDAHLADEVTLDALEQAALAGAAAPVLAVALGRPAFEVARPDWGRRAAAREEVALGPLGPEPAAALCRALLRPVQDVPARAIAQLVARAEGVPLFLVELTRCLKREGAVRRHGRGDGFYLATDELERASDLPLVDWLAQRELAAMPPELRAHAELVSLLGAEITTATVEGVLRVLERRGEAQALGLDAGAGVRRLVAAGLLVTHPDGRLGFRHALVRDAVARTLLPERRARLHRAAFDHGSVERAPRLAELAWHAAEAGLHDAARDAYLALGERARDAHAYLDAGAFYTSALAQPGEAPPSLCRRAHRGRALVHYRLGRYDDALADLVRARELSRAAGDVEGEVELLLDEGTILDWMDNFRASEACVAEAEALAKGIASPLVEARLLLGLGRSHHRFGREEEARALLTAAAAAADRLGDEGYETAMIARIVLGFVLPGLGRLSDAERVLDRAIAEATARADRLHLFAALNNRALAWGYRMDKARMIETFERTLEIAVELGQTTMELVAHFNLGEYLSLMGDAAAWAHIAEAVAIERRLLGDAARPIVALLRARAHLRAGEIDAARAVVEAIRAQQAAARARGQTEALLVPAEEVLCAAVALATGGADDRAWHALVERSAQVSIGQERIEVLELGSLALRRAGRVAAARAALEQAVALAETIPNVLGERLRRDLEGLYPVREAG